MNDSYARLLPPVTDTNRQYWDGLAQGELRLQQCDACGAMRYPDAPCCPECLCDAHTWKPVSGRATLWSWIIMHQRYFEAFDELRPYLVVQIKLEEGPLMVSSLIDPPDQLEVDAPLKVEFVKSPADRIIPKFRVVS
ncbi:MAG: OB-fold domain-containing protein [Bifidobacteriaceae bacterium]|jgi:uncharacterized OB-fold protein|nr:OB-fold domain-containing protein [Bifidobacteriaceae bacterium]